jgi:hypothetical protein
LPPELSLVRLASARNFIEACLQAECRRPSAAELLSYEFISPNEEDDFLEVRVRLDTVAEQATSLELEDDEDNSDEEPLSSGVQRDHPVRQPSPMLPDNERMDQSHNGSGHHHRGFGDRSESRSTPRIPSQSADDSFTKPPLARAKTLSHLNGDLISQQPNLSGPLSDPQTNHANFSQINPNISSPEKNPETNGTERNVSSETSDPQNDSVKTPDSRMSPEETSSSSTTTPNARKRLSGTASGHSHEFHKTTSRVLRVCLTESGSRGRSSSFIDVPLSPITTETPADQLSLLPNSGMTPSRSHSNSRTVSPAATSLSSDQMPHPHHHHIFHDPSLPSHASYPSYAAAVCGGGGEGPVAVADHDTPQNFLGVVDVGDKGSFDDDGKLLHENCLIFRLRVPFQTTFKEIEFGFDLLHDHPQSIVDEMNEVDELIFLAPYAKQIVDSLTPIVEVAKRVLSEKSMSKTATTATAAVPQRNQEEPTLSDLVLERYLATRGEGNADPALAAWSNAAEERKIKENEAACPPPAAAVPLRSHQPIQVNLGTELHHSPPLTSRSGHGQGDESSRTEHLSGTSDVLHSRPSKSITRSVTQSSDPEKISNSSSIPSLVRDKSSNTSPTKIPPESDSQSGLRDGQTSPYLPVRLISSQDCRLVTTKKSLLPQLKTTRKIFLMTTIQSTKRSTPNIWKLLQSLNLIPPPHLSFSSLTLLPPSLRRIEKDYHHIKANIASQKEKATENYKREHEKIINRQNDLNKQLENMEERFKVPALLTPPPLSPCPSPRRE